MYVRTSKSFFYNTLNTAFSLANLEQLNYKPGQTTDLSQTETERSGWDFIGDGWDFIGAGWDFIGDVSLFVSRRNDVTLTPLCASFRSGGIKLLPMTARKINDVLRLRDCAYQRCNPTLIKMGHESIF